MSSPVVYNYTHDTFCGHREGVAQRQGVVLYVYCICRVRRSGSILAWCRFFREILCFPLSTLGHRCFDVVSLDKAFHSCVLHPTQVWMSSLYDWYKIRPLSVTATIQGMYAPRGVEMACEWTNHTTRDQSRLNDLRTPNWKSVFLVNVFVDYHLCICCSICLY